jgi:hypothetical protein
MHAWKKVKTAGTVSLVVGILKLLAVLPALLLGFLFLFAGTLSDAGATFSSEDQAISLVYAVVLFIGVPLLIIFGIIDIVAGNKLRKPIANPRGWLIYTIVVGALGISTLTGILQLIFGILAVSSIHEIEGKEPPEKI